MEDVPSQDSPVRTGIAGVEDTEQNAGGRPPDRIWQFFKKEQHGQGKPVYARCKNSECKAHFRVRSVIQLYKHIENKCKNRSDADRCLVKTWLSEREEALAKPEKKRKGKNDKKGRGERQEDPPATATTSATGASAGQQAEHGMLPRLPVAKPGKRYLSHLTTPGSSDLIAIKSKGPAGAVKPPRRLEDLILETTPCMLEPYMFFVSWQGVLTLAFRGFPPALVKLKQDIGVLLPNLPKENPGSLWPKCSFGALRDNKRLTPDQLNKLNSICWEQSETFSENPRPIVVDHASILLYECRSLEKLISRQRIPFKRDGEGPEGVDVTRASEEEATRVEGIVREAEDPDYWYAASKDGNRESHYRGTALGATLVFRFEDADLRHVLLPSMGEGVDSGGHVQSQIMADLLAYPHELPSLLAKIRSFAARVESELPGMYSFFDESSLHVTLRALMG